MELFCKIYFDRTVARQEAKWERGRENREMFASQDSNLGRPKHYGTTRRQASHEAIGADNDNLIIFEESSSSSWTTDLDCEAPKCYKILQMKQLLQIK